MLTPTFHTTLVPSKEVVTASSNPDIWTLLSSTASLLFFAEAILISEWNVNLKKCTWKRGLDAGL